MFPGVRSRKRKPNPIILPYLNVLEGNGINLSMELSYTDILHTDGEQGKWVGNWRAMTQSTCIQKRDTMNQGTKNNLYKPF